MKLLKNKSWLLGLFCATIAVSFARADDIATADLKLVPSGVTDTVGFYIPRLLPLSAEKPAAMKKVPALSAPLYGSISFAGKSYLVALDEPADKDASIYVDANGNGDLTDDPPVVWNKHAQPTPSGQQLNLYLGNFMLPLPTAGGSTPVQITAYRFDKNDPNRPQLKTTLLYYRDYGYDGQITLNGTHYHAMLLDNAANGDFSALRRQTRPAPSY